MFYESIELTKFRNVEIEQREIDGKMEECISIPIERNSLYKLNNGRVFLKTFLIEKRPNPDNQSHFVSVCIRDEKLREEIERLGFRKDLNYIGYAKVYNKNRKYYYRQDKVPLDEAMEK